MKSFNVVTGLPRTGSTLMCNILNQNPKFYASSTSPLPQMCATLSNIWSHSPEISSMLIQDRDAANNRMSQTMRSMIDAWYHGYNIVFDKSRGWANNSLLLEALYPESLSIVMVRDLRSVMGSIEKQHKKNPILDHAQHPIGKTLYARADQMFSPEGMIGGPIISVEDVLRREPNNSLIIKYEDFAANPLEAMDEIYTAMNLEMFDHDFNNVVNVAEDVDDLYLGKFEHKGEGKVKPVDSGEWKEYVSQDIADLIMERFPFYNEELGYT